MARDGVMLFAEDVTGTTNTDAQDNPRTQWLLFIIAGSPAGTYTLQFYSPAQADWVDLFELTEFATTLLCPAGQLRLKVAGESSTTSVEVAAPVMLPSPA